jgi:hypothetical protein
MNNEPVAWMSSVNGETVYVGYEPADGWLAIPLYTHPAKTPTLVLDGNRVYPAFKELTDAEIMESCHAYHYTYNPDYLGFAREILRKAQEYENE